VILQSPSDDRRVLRGLADLILDPLVERLRIAVAYANPAGVEALRTLLSVASDHVQVEVIVTLDMGITRKAALQRLLQQFGKDARVIASETGTGTFHAKAFVANREDSAARALIGSANLTGAALTRNREAISVVDLDQDQSAAWEEWWAELMAKSEMLTSEIIDGYVERRPPAGRRERIADEDVETRDDGSSVSHEAEASAEEASWLVIDWGGTGEYRLQAEFPQAAATFFRPEIEHERLITIRYENRDYEDNLLRYYPDNGMARVNLDAEIPIVADRSVLEGTLLFTRFEADSYGLQLVSWEERAERLAEAAATGGRHFTQRRDGSRREFGWV